MSSLRDRIILVGFIVIAQLRLAGATGQDGTFETAFALFQRGDLNGAQDLLLKDVQRNPSALEFSLLGSIDVARGELKEAEHHLERALALEPGLPGTRFTLATVLEAEGKLPDAEAALERVVAEQPKETRSLLELARVRNLRGESEAALASALKAKKMEPNNAAVLYSVGILCLQMDLIKDGTAYLERSVVIDPTPITRYALASARIANRDLAAAIQIYRDLLKTDPENAQVNYALGATYFLQGDNDSALPYFEKSIALEPKQVESFYYLGLISDQNGNHIKGLEMLKMVIERQPDHARAHAALGMEYHSLGRLSEARNELETAVRLNPESLKAHYQLGLVLAALNQKDDAAKEFETAKHLRASSDERVAWQLLQDSSQAVINGTATR